MQAGLAGKLQTTDQQAAGDPPAHLATVAQLVELLVLRVAGGNALL